MRNAVLGFVAILVAGVLAFPSRAVPIPPNVPVTGPQPGLQNEEQVWICPTDTSIVVTNHRDFRLGYRQIGIGRGAMGGSVWVDSLIHPDFQVFTHQSDPIMTVNSAGDIFISHLDYRQGVTPSDSSCIAFLVSSDCGATWNGPYTVEDTIGPYFEDKQFMTCDRTGGVHDGNIYISWSRFDNPTRIMFARSTTNAVTFDDTLIVGAANYVSCLEWTVDAGQFSQPLVGKDGAVYVFWVGVGYDTLGGNCDAHSAIRMNKSTDGGVTFQGERVLFPVEGWGWVDGDIDVYSQPTTDADITGGPHAGNLYLQYRDAVGPPFYESDIFFRRSLDTGHTWSAPMRVNDDPIGPDVDQFHNWLVCNNEGVLVSIWYDQRTDPGHFDFDVFAAYSFDGGATWTSNHRVSSVSISPGFLASESKRTVRKEFVTPLSPLEIQSPQAGLIAEYIGVSCIDDKVVAVWTDTRDATGPGDQDVYSANWYLQVTEPRLLSPINGVVVNGWPSLRWSAAWKAQEDSYRLQIATDSQFDNVVLDEIADTNYYQANNYPAFGTLYWRVKAFGPNEFGEPASTEFSEPAHYYQDGECFCWYQSDFDTDGFITALDLGAMIDILFAGAPDVQDSACPTPRADFDCDGFSTALDLAGLIDHLFAGGNPPCDPCSF